MHIPWFLMKTGSAAAILLALTQTLRPGDPTIYDMLVAQPLEVNR